MCESSNNSTLVKLPFDAWIMGETFLARNTENFLGMTHPVNKFVQLRRGVEGGTVLFQEAAEFDKVNVVEIILRNSLRSRLTRRSMCTKREEKLLSVG